MAWVFRALFLVVFALYWGGLTFYTGFVVRISHDVLDDPMDGGLITQRVTAVLQVLGVVALAMMAINCVVVARHSRKFGYALVGCALLLGCSLIGLFMVHGHLDSVIDIETSAIIDRDEFTVGHRRYNQLTTLQWVVSLTYLLISIGAWQSTDAGVSRPSD